MRLIIKNNNMYGLGWGSERFLRFLALYELEGWGIPLGDPWLVSLNASYHKEQQYIWFRGWVLNGF